MGCIIYSPHWLRTILLFVVKSAFYILTLAWGFRRCSFRLAGQCEGLYTVERVTELAPRFFVCISECIPSTRESVGFIVYGIRMNILQNNPYRLLGVYSNSPTKERLANHNRMKAFLKVGKSVSFPLDLPHFFSSINRTEASVADAEAKLTLPKEQILYAQFWFVKNTPLDEVAFYHLFAGDIAKAEEIWQKRECASSLQNLIVCALMCCDYELAVDCAARLYGNAQYVKELIQTVIGEGGQSDAENLAYSFLDELCKAIGTKELLPLITNAAWRSYIAAKAIKPLIDSIQNAIGKAKKSKDNGAIARYEAGLTLKDETANALSELKIFLTTADIQYQTIADKLAQVILQCGIDYYNKTDDDDAPKKAMVLQKYALSVAVGTLMKSRCEENVKILSNVGAEYAVRNELARLMKNIKELRGENGIGCLHFGLSGTDVKKIVEECIPDIEAIKAKMGNTAELYIKVASAVVSAAVNALVEYVNFKQSVHTASNKDAEEFRLAISYAIMAMKTIGRIDMNYKTQEYYNRNNNTLQEIANGLQPPASDDDFPIGCILYIAIGLLFLFMAVLR